MFEEYETNMNRVDKGDFLKFCKDFHFIDHFKLKKEKLIEIFNKCSSCHSPIDFEQFITALSLSAGDINKS